MRTVRFAAASVFAATLSVYLCIPQKAEAVPQFARRYNLKCSACHTIPPVLNEQGYMFKRLGFHLPPSLAAGQTAESIAYLARNEQPWTLTSNLSFSVADFGYQIQHATSEGSNSSTSSGFQVNSWNAYFGGGIPDTNFFYFGEFDIVTNGVVSPDMPNAFFGYAGGNARSSWFISGGRRLLQAAEGTRAAAVYSLLPASPLLFENMTSTNFILDQAPVGVTAGYTYATSSYHNIFAITGKVTNGDNADGTETLGLSSRTGKDTWLDVDWWYAPESGITFVDYYGTKNQIQNAGADNQFTYQPHIRRQGIFGNYMIANRVDLLGGYLRNHDDWEYVEGVSGNYFNGNDGFFAVDYYLKPGFALSGRYDLLKQNITAGVGPTSMHQLSAGINKTFTRSGNIVGRIGYSYLSGRDPLSGDKSTSSAFETDIMFNF